MKTKTSRPVPLCRFCGRSNGAQFNIFTPRFKPFGTACVECEKVMPAGVTPPPTGDLLIYRMHGTSASFIAKISALSGIAKLPPLAVYALWRKYADDCASSDQSALLGEFVEWYAPALGNDRAALRQALSDQPQLA